MEAALAKYQKLLEENQRKMDFENTFLEAHSFMEDKEAYVISAVRYYHASLAVASCQRLIKNCKWILDME